MQSGGSASRVWCPDSCRSRKRWSKRALCATSSESPANPRKRGMTLETDGAPRSSRSRSPVRRATGSGRGTPGLTSDSKESTISSAFTRTAPTSQIRLRAAESPVVSRSKTTSSASSSSRSGPVSVSETVAPLQTMRLSPAVASARSEQASPVEIEDVANTSRAASTADIEPRSSSESTSRSSASRASCTHQ